VEIEIVWSERASQNLHHIYEYIAHDSVYYAERFVSKMVVSIEKQLISFPHTGRFVPELTHTPYHFLKEVIFGNYRILYNPDNLPHKITIIAVVHAKQKIQKLPIEDWVIE
jgi:toxin ParE1/3/4